MTEAEWQKCADPRKWVSFLIRALSDRKARLLACAYCRVNWQQLYDQRSRTAVEVAEDFADNAATPEELDRAFQASAAAEEYLRRYIIGSEHNRWLRAYQAHLLTNPGARAWLHDLTGDRYRCREFGRRICLVRDVVMDPFRPHSVDSGWLTRTVLDLAQAIYDDRAFADLPILADALEDAGCTDRAILDHCRQPGEHVRGCWAVDLVLGKS